MEEIRIGKKSKGKYISSVLFGFQEGHSKVVVSALGTRVSKAYEVTDQVTQLLRDVELANSESFEVDGKTGARITLEKEGNK